MCCTTGSTFECYKCFIIKSQSISIKYAAARARTPHEILLWNCRPFWFACKRCDSAPFFTLDYSKFGHRITAQMNWKLKTRFLRLLSVWKLSLRSIDCSALKFDRFRLLILIDRKFKQIQIHGTNGLNKRVCGLDKSGVFFVPRLKIKYVRIWKIELLHIV